MHFNIGVNRPAFGGTVPHFHQMSRVPRNETDVPHFFKWWLLFFCVADYFTFLPWNATKWRIKLGSYFARRQTPSIFHAWQPSPVTVYFVTPPAASTLLPWRALGDGFSLDNRQRSSDSARCFPYILGIWHGGGKEPPLKKIAPNNYSLIVLSNIAQKYIRLHHLQYRFLKISGGGDPRTPLPKH